MVDIEVLKKEIVAKLKPLDPDKIILFGSYAYGKPTEASDVDLFLVKDLEKEKVRTYKIELRKRLRDLVFKYNLGFDFVVTSEDVLNNREDYFYKVDILQKGKVLYAK
jgi:predicted nucleotidyltransferase